MADIQRTTKIGGFQKKVIRFFSEIRTELKKVIWPTWEQLVNNTITVLLACLIIGAIIWVADLGFSKLLELILIRG